MESWIEVYVPDFLKTISLRDEVVVFADPRHALQCKRIDAPRYIDEFMKLGFVKVANLTFTSKVVIADIGVGQGFSKKSSPRPPR